MLEFHYSLAKSSRHGCRTRAYNLTEIAIVLAVIGAITGVVWTLAGTIHAATKTRETTDIVLQTIQNIRDHYSGVYWPSGWTQNVSLTTTIDTYDLFPQQTRRYPSYAPGSTSQVIKHPWATQMTSSSVSVSVDNTTTYTNSLVIQVGSMDQDACARLALSIPILDRDLGIKKITINSNTYTTAMPTASQAKSACSLTTGANSVAWTFYLHMPDWRTLQ